MRKRNLRRPAPQPAAAAANVSGPNGAVTLDRSAPRIGARPQDEDGERREDEGAERPAPAAPRR